MTCIKGYKAFNLDLTCRRYQFEVGKLHVHEGPLEMCVRGFHYCCYPVDIIHYYNWIHSAYRIFEIEAGESVHDESKSVTLSIKLIREIPREEMFKLCTGTFIWDGGIQIWYKNGIIHRENGPAVIFPKGEKWMQNGLLHRIDGPAYRHSELELYFRHGVRMNVKPYWS